MLQEIEPKKYYSEYKVEKPKKTDIALIFQENKILMKKTKEGEVFPTFEQVFLEESETRTEEEMNQTIQRKHLTIERAIAIDETAFYLIDWKESLVLEEKYMEEKYTFVSTEVIRHYPRKDIAFAVATAWHIWRWRKKNQFCGVCGKPMHSSERERAMVCKSCGNMSFPKISPAIVVAITDGNRLLLARNKHGAFQKYALIAGYVEVGETFEDTVRREVMEEVGLRVKNIQYYKNQPWAMTEAQMIGFTAELDGSDELHLQEDEIQEARWFIAEEIPEDIAELSLTYEMIRNFREEKIGSQVEAKAAQKYCEHFDRK